MSILLVDDDEAANFLNTRLIERVAKEVDIHSVLNGKEALNFIYNNKEASVNDTKDHQPVIIFLDINMPVMNGFEFLEAIDSLGTFDYNKMPIVVLSSSANIKDMERAKTHNIYGYLSKPLTREKVEKILHDVQIN